MTALDFTTTVVYRSRRWWDFETFFSCSRKPVGFMDNFTRQPAECNIAKILTCQAYLRAFELTGNHSLLSDGLRVLEYTLLTQQTWSHPLLSAKLLGGTTTQNTDSEWSDARQAYLANVLLGFY